MGFAGRRSEKVGMVGQRPSVLKALGAALMTSLFWSTPVYFFGFRNIWSLVREEDSETIMYLPLLVMLAMMFIPPMTAFFGVMKGADVHLGAKHEDGTRIGLAAMMKYALEKNHGHPEAKRHKHGGHREATGSFLTKEGVHHEEQKLTRLYKEGYLTKEQYEKKMKRIRT